MKLYLACALLVFFWNNLQASAGHHGIVPAAATPTADPNVITPEQALKMNLENAVKLYLHDRGMLTPGDVSTTAGPVNDAPVLKHGHPIPGHRAAPAMKCDIPDGCVILPAKQRFLTNKYIPGNDNILSPYFIQRGHFYVSTSTDDITDFDLKAYIMSRPKHAVPESVRHLLMPEGDAAWPGGEGGDRTPYYPKDQAEGTAYWETDLESGLGIEKHQQNENRRLLASK